MFVQSNYHSYEGDANGDTLEVPFIGRETLRESIKNHITGKIQPRRHLIQLCGPPMIGKSRLAIQILDELRQESIDRKIDNFVTSFITVRDLVSLDPIKMQLMHLFQFPDASIVTFSSSLSDHFVADKTTHYIIVLDNCESMSHHPDLVNGFPVLVEQLMRASHNVTVILTSSVQLSFPNIYHNKRLMVPVPPLTPRDSESLLARITPDVNYTNPETLKDICELCYHYPFTVIFVGRLLQDETDLTPEEIVTILKRESFEGLEEDIDAGSNRPDGIVAASLSHLRNELKRISAIFAYFPATFGEEAAKIVAGFQSIHAVKSKALIPMKHRSIVEYNSDNRRYTMHSVLRDFFNRKLYDLNDMKTTRRRFANYFGESLIKVNGMMTAFPQKKVLQEIANDWPNIEHLLREAFHCCDDDTYSVYMKVVRSAERFILQFMPSNGVAFYQELLNHAERLGIEDDKMILLAHLGNAMSNSTHYSQEECLVKMEDAYGRMIKSGNDHGYLLKRLLGSIAWLYLQMGMAAEAEKLQRLALNVLVNDIPEDQRQYLDVKYRSHLSQSVTFLGRYNESNAIINEALELALVKSPNNAAINIMLNQIGINHDKRGRAEEALAYYQRSLAARRNNKDEEYLIEPLNNVATCLMGLGKYDECLKYLEEARSIQKKLSLAGRHSAEIQRNFGQYYHHLNNFQKALTLYEEAHATYEQSSTKHYELYGVKLSIGMCHEGLGQREEAIGIYRGIVDESFNYYWSDDKDRVMKEASERLIDLLDDDPKMRGKYKSKNEQKFIGSTKLYGDKRDEYSEDVNLVQESKKKKVPTATLR